MPSWKPFIPSEVALLLNAFGCFGGDPDSGRDTPAETGDAGRADDTAPRDTALADTGTSAGDPALLVINEVLVVNTASNADGSGEFDSWLEIYNTGSEPVELDGVFLTDDDSQPDQYGFPNDVAIDAHGHVGVWCDGQPEQESASEYHTPFLLNRGGDALYLNFVGKNGMITADSVYWQNAVTPDLAAARLPDGGEAWVSQAPTFAASNGN